MKTFLENIILIVKVLEEIRELLKGFRLENRIELLSNKEEVWLDSNDVQRLLNIGRVTLYRRRTEGGWVAKKIGKKWFYLKSSLSR